MNIPDCIPRYRKDINKCLTKIYPTVPKSLTKPIQYVLSGAGKRIRPLLAIFSAESCGGNKDDVMSSALAVEVLHNFTLVHDDIMDQDNIRHGQETVHHKWDDGVAILTGDAMLSIALNLLNQSSSSRHELMKIFIDGLLTVCEGQALDKEYESNATVSVEDYLRMIDLKTGHMIGLAAEIGAISAGGDKKTSEALRDYGRLLGRAFQIQDDYLEIFSDSDNMGKSLESDIILEKKTFLMIHALKKNDGVIKNAISIAKNNFDKGMKEIREYMQIEGIQKSTRNTILQIIQLADEKLLGLNIDTTKLLYFSELIRHRGH